MKFIRALLSVLVLVVAIAAILAAAAFVPAVQTWIAQMALAEKPELKATLGSLAAGINHVEVADLHLEYNGCVLTLPSLQAALSLPTAARDKKVFVQSLLAKGWTLDLSHLSQPDQGTDEGAPPSESQAAPSTNGDADTAQKAEGIFRGILAGWKLPFDASLDSLDAEGDVLLPALPGKSPSRVHLIIKGGGMSVSHQGEFSIDAESSYLDSSVQVNTVSAHGRLIVSMGSPRSIGRIEIKADLSGKGGSFPEDFVVSADVAAARRAGGETYSVDLGRGGRRLATLLASLPEASQELSGTWRVDMRDTDLALFVPGHPLPSFAAAGGGNFDADPSFTRVHAAGRLESVANGLGRLATPLDSLETVKIDARFDLTQSAQSLRVDSLSVTLAGDRPVAVARSIQPFDVDEKTGDVKLSDAHADAWEGSIQGLPLSWLSGLAHGLRFEGSDATCDFVIRAADGDFSLRTKTPLASTGVSVTYGGRTLEQGLDLSAPLLADYSSQGWQIQISPLTLSSSGRRLATIEAKASQSGGSDQPIAISGTWDADIGALASHSAMPGIGGASTRPAKGDFSVSAGTTTQIEANIAVSGHDPANSVTANVNAGVGTDGGISFLVPVTVKWGSETSDVSAEGTLSSDDAGARVDIKLTGENVALDHFRPIAAPLGAAWGIRLPPGLGPQAAGGLAGKEVRDKIPFWGNWVGRVSVAFDQMRADGHDFKDVGGTIEFDHASLQLEGGRGWLSRHRMAKAEGSLTFDAAAEFPYKLKASAGVDGIDAVSLFPAPQADEDPMVEGHFSVDATLSGSGLNWDDLVGRSHEEIRLASKDGIIRLLRTSVAESIPEVATPVKDAMSTVGSVVGSIFRVKTGSADSDKNPVSKTAEAVLDFTNEISEIGYDQLTLTASQGSDQSLHLVGIEMDASDVRVIGSGQITHVSGLPVPEQPLSLDLKLSARGDLGQLLSTAGLLTSQKDKDGFTPLIQGIHLGGTLEQIDESQWHDLLARAATRQPQVAKKSG